MKNKGLKLFGGILALIIAAFIVLTLTIDGVVKSGIEDSGSNLLQTEVSVEDVSISLFSGSGSIKNFTVANPVRFSDKYAIVFQKASMKIDLSSLFSDQIIVEDMTIESPQLYFEQKGFGINLKTLNDNMDLSSGEESETGLIIEHLLIENGQVTVRTEIDKERTTSASISSFELNGIGKDGSNTIQQSVKEVLQPLIEKAIAEAVKEGVVDQLKNKVDDFLNN